MKKSPATAFKAAMPRTIPFEARSEADKVKMEEIMDVIDRAPDSFDVIIGYGEPLFKRLEKMAVENLKVQSRYAETVDRLGAALSLYDAGYVDIKTAKFIKDLNDIKTTLADFAEARKEISMGISLHLSAADEVSRRYNEKYITEASDKFSQSQDPMDEMVLKDTRRRLEQFGGRVAALSQTQVLSATFGQQLRQMVDGVDQSLDAIKTVEAHKKAFKAVKSIKRQLK